MIIKLVVWQAILLYLAGISLFGGTKGILGAGIILSFLNLYVNYSSSSVIFFWQIIIIIYTLTGIIINYLFNRSTENLRILKVSAASFSSLLNAGIFFSFIPALFIWTVLIAIPLIFNYKSIPKSLFWQVFFKFIFSLGWIIIGNIFYNV